MHTYVGEFDHATGRHEVWIETSGRAGRRPLRPAAVADEASFEWGSARPGATGLAAAILETELGLDIPESVSTRFREDVVATLPQDGFRLGANEVMDWARANRALIDADIFGV